MVATLAGALWLGFWAVVLLAASWLLGVCGLPGRCRECHTAAKAGHAAGCTRRGRTS